jgi:hypothetical protein
LGVTEGSCEHLLRKILGLRQCPATTTKESHERRTHLREE